MTQAILPEDEPLEVVLVEDTVDVLVVADDSYTVTDNSVSYDVVTFDDELTVNGTIVSEDKLLVGISSVPGPAGPSGPPGPSGAAGVVHADYPFTYDADTQTIGLDDQIFEDKKNEAVQETEAYVDQRIAGLAGGGAYIYNQLSPASEWTVVHNLNTFPAVTVVDSANQEVYGDVKYTDRNSLTISFSSTFSGSAYLT